MGRKKRIWLPNYFYHVVCRGNRRDPLFKDAADFLTFMYILRKVYEKTPFELASYCLMTNHFHLQLRSRDYPISKIMSLINKRYANYYNTRYHLTGHVYEKRYYDKMIDFGTGMLEVSRYIHLNPVRANMVSLPQEYPWSSYLHYQNQTFIRYPFINHDILLEHFLGELDQKVEKYCQYVIELQIEEST
ncbi:transposase [Terrilactibacillus laevilacticus]|uniref:transposase n=1 Tax=Terrilactibacillus laevilacticus TaxID=1380157 RepID=UPI001146CBB2|nr:transposase [Terrilactibacillus laevilacticus]